MPLRGRPLLGHAVDTVARAARGWRRWSSSPRPGSPTPPAPSWAGVDLPPDAVVVAGGAVAHRLGGRRPGRRWVTSTSCSCTTPPAASPRWRCSSGSSRRCAAGAAGAVPGIPLVDTVKTVDADGVITGTPDRASLRAVQTPQGFAREVLVAAYAGGLEATDDAALVELGGHHVVVVDGDAAGVQGDHAATTSSTPSGCWRSAPRPSPAGCQTDAMSALPRVGIGVDVHALAARGVRARAVGRRAALARGARARRPLRRRRRRARRVRRALLGGRHRRPRGALRHGPARAGRGVGGDPARRGGPAGARGRVRDRQRRGAGRRQRAQGRQPPGRGAGRALGCRGRTRVGQRHHHRRAGPDRPRRGRRRDRDRPGGRRRGDIDH